MDNCIFCKILKGEIPCKKICETKMTLTFLDIDPVTKGHALIIPKKHYKNIHEIPEDILCDIIKITKNIAKQLKEKLNATGINIINSNGKDAQQDVDHIHFHIIPRYSNDKFNIWRGKQKQEFDLDKIHQQLIQ